MIVFGVIFIVMHGIRILPASLASIFARVEHPSQAQFTIYDSLLKKYASDGLVDYSALKKDKDLDAAVNELERLAPDKLSYNGQVCYWINVHNLLVLKIISDRYPIKSSPSIGVDLASRKFSVGGEVLSVQRIFRQKIFPLLKRASGVPEKIFLVCGGTIAYPPLTDHALVPEHLDADARAAAYKYITNENNVFFDDERGIFYVSPLLKRYEPIFITVDQNAYTFAANYLNSERSPDLNDIMLTKSFMKNIDLRINDKAGFKTAPQLIDEEMK